MEIEIYLSVSVSIYLGDTYFKELAHTTLECGKFKICRWLADWIPREEMQFEKSKDSLLANFLLAQGNSEFVFISLSTDWVRPIHMEVSLLYSNVNLIYRIPSQKYLE